MTDATLPLPLDIDIPARSAGVDAAGRGPLAGPVCVAAVILDPAHPIAGPDDSKALSARRREALFDQITQRALALHVVMIACSDIDSINILVSTMLGMRRVVVGLVPAAEWAHVCGH